MSLWTTLLNLGAKYIPVVGPAISGILENEQVSGFLSGAAKGVYGTRKGKKEPTYKADYAQSEQEQQYNRQLTVTELGFAAEDPLITSGSVAGITRQRVQALYRRYSDVASIAQHQPYLTSNLFAPIAASGPAKTRDPRRMYT